MDSMTTLCEVKNPKGPVYEVPSCVKVIGHGAFRDCVDLEAVILPQGLEELEGGVFMNCEALRHIELPAQLRTISSFAFAESYISTFDLAPGNKWFRIDDGILYSMDGKCLIRADSRRTGADVVIPHGVEVIYEEAFKGHEEIRSLTFPDTLRSILTHAFGSMPNLREVVIPQGVEEIELGAFENCTSLVSVTIQEGLEDLQLLAFSRCDSLASVQLPSSLKSIGSYAFGDGKSLRSIEIGANVECIDSKAFGECDNLVVTLDPRNRNYKLIDGCLYDNEGTRLITVFPAMCPEELVVPDGVTSIEWWAVVNCGNLKSVVLPDSLKEISIGAFKDCVNLQKVRLPAGPCKMGEEIFWGCGEVELL